MAIAAGAVALSAAACGQASPVREAVDSQLPLAEVSPTDEQPVTPTEPSATSPRETDQANCTAQTGPQSVDIRWWNLPAGVDISILSGGKVVADAGRSTADQSGGTYSLFGASGGPDKLYELELQPDGDAGEPERLTCITTAPTTVPFATTTTAATTMAGDAIFPPVHNLSTTSPSAEATLLEAKALFLTKAIRPHIYVTGTFDGQPVELHLGPGADGVRVFKPPIDDDTLRNPLTLHDDLVSAIQQGNDVSYVLDPGSGLPQQWTVDGVLREFHCVETDTAPPELRIGTCDKTRDLMEGG